MKTFFRIILMIFLLFSSSCGATTPRPPLSFNIVFDKENFKSFEEVSARVILKNTGDETILVNKRLYFQTDPFYPPETIEGLFLITDSSGQKVTLHGKIDIGFPRDEFFISLSPGELVERKITLYNLGFTVNDFKANELYTVILIYQNSLDVKQTIDNRVIQAWKGKIESNTASFKIAP